MGKIASIELKYYKSSLDIYRIYKNLFTHNSVIFTKRMDVIKNDFIYMYFVDYDGLEISMDNDSAYIDFILSLISGTMNFPIGLSCYINDMNLHHTIHPDLDKNNDDKYISIQITEPRMIKSVNIPDFSFYANKLLSFFEMKMVKIVEFSYF